MSWRFPQSSMYCRIVSQSCSLNFLAFQCLFLFLKQRSENLETFGPSCIHLIGKVDLEKICSSHTLAHSSLSFPHYYPSPLSIPLWFTWSLFPSLPPKSRFGRDLKPEVSPPICVRVSVVVRVHSTKSPFLILFFFSGFLSRHLVSRSFFFHVILNDHIRVFYSPGFLLCLIVDVMWIVVVDSCF